MENMEVVQTPTLTESEHQEDERLQLAENTEIEQEQKEVVENEFVEKRNLLQKTKIVRQTWSIAEIYQKIKDRKLILDPDYQRRAIWGNDKKTAFIESLYMEIMIPPIYVVEIPGEDILDETKYEVVDKDLIELLTFDQLEAHSFEILQNYDVRKMDNMTQYIASNIVYMRKIIAELEPAGTK